MYSKNILLGHYLLFFEANLLQYQNYPRVVYDLSMALSSYRIHRIYLAATMGYGLGSDDPEELSYYNKFKKGMKDMKKVPVKKGIPLSFEINYFSDK